MKRSKAEIRDELLKIDTGFKDGKDEIGVDSFASFLTTKGKFPSNDDIEKEFKERGIESFTPKDFQSKKSNSGESQEALFDKNSFEFPDDFFNKDEDFNNKYMFVGLNAAFREGKNEYSNWRNFRDVKRPTNTYKLYVQTNERLANNKSRFGGCYITDVIKHKEDSNAGNVMRDFLIRNKLSFLKSSKEDLENGVYDDERVSQFLKWQKNRNENRKNKSADGINYKKETLTKDDFKKINEENKKNLLNSVEIFVQECLIIKPKYIIAIGKDAKRVLDEMSKSKLFLEVLHNEEGDSNSEAEVLKTLKENCVEITHYATHRIPVENDPDKERGYSFKEWLEYAPTELSDRLKIKEPKK